VTEPAGWEERRVAHHIAVAHHSLRPSSKFRSNMEYFLVKNLGYDGLVITRSNSLGEAESLYKEDLRRQKDWDEKYPRVPSDKGLVVIRGEVVISDSPGEIFG